MASPRERGISNTPAERIQLVRQGLREQPGFVHPTWSSADQFLTTYGVEIDNPGGTYHGWVFSPSVFNREPLRLGKDRVSLNLRRAPASLKGEFKEEIELEARFGRAGVRNEHNMNMGFTLNKQGIKTREGAEVTEEQEAAVADFVGFVILQQRYQR